jgi:hypothetical protein
VFYHSQRYWCIIFCLIFIQDALCCEIWTCVRIVCFWYSTSWFSVSDICIMCTAYNSCFVFVFYGGGNREVFQFHMEIRQWYFHCFTVHFNSLYMIVQLMNALVCNKTLIQMSHTKTLKITPTCFDHQMIIIRELFDPG